jgi:hypothetical protein
MTLLDASFVLSTARGTDERATELIQSSIEEPDERHGNRATNS